MSTYVYPISGSSALNKMRWIKRTWNVDGGGGASNEQFNYRFTFPGDWRQTCRGIAQPSWIEPLGAHRNESSLKWGRKFLFWKVQKLRTSGKTHQEAPILEVCQFPRSTSWPCRKRTSIASQYSDHSGAMGYVLASGRCRRRRVGFEVSHTSGPCSTPVHQ